MNNNEIEKLAVVIGGVHHNTLGVIRGLGEKGVKTILLLHDNTDKHQTFVEASRYVKKVYKVVCDQVFNVLIERIPSDFLSLSKIVVIPCSDFASSLLDAHYNQLSSKYYLPGISCQGEVNKMMNKQTMAEFAKQHGLLIPNTYEFSQITPESDVFPVILKPLKSIEGSKADIHICRNYSEWQNAMKMENNPVQVQHYIDKEIEYQLIGCSLDGGRIVIIPGATNMIRQPENTNTGYLKYLPKELFSAEYENSVKFLSAARYSGLFSIEFIRDKQGKDYFMEINMRNDGNAYCVTKAGVNLPYIWYVWNTQGRVENPVEFHKEIYSMPEYLDIMNVFHGEVSFLSWIKEFWQCKSYMLINSKDPKPFFTYFWRRLMNKIIKTLC